MSQIASVDEELKFTGTQVNYYFVCKRKLWLFSHDITMEHESDLVHLGKLTHKRHYKRESEEISIGRIKVDFMADACEVYEVKKTESLEESHLFQLLYYLYVLRKRGIEAKGSLRYPNQRKVKRIELTEERKQRLKDVLEEIQAIVDQASPPPLEKKPYCTKCSYYQYCFA